MKKEGVVLAVCSVLACMLLIESVSAACNWINWGETIQHDKRSIHDSRMICYTTSGHSGRYQCYIWGPNLNCDIGQWKTGCGNDVGEGDLYSAGYNQVIGSWTCTQDLESGKWCQCTGTSCKPDNTGKRCNNCGYISVSSVPETCDNIDNDCDGAVDEEVGCPATDTDGDSMPNDWETTNGLNPNDADDADDDPDSDGLTNLQEFQNGTNPNNADTDGDLVKDGIEVARGTDPIDDEDYPDCIVNAVQHSCSEDGTKVVSSEACTFSDSLGYFVLGSATTVKTCRADEICEEGDVPVNCYPVSGPDDSGTEQPFDYPALSCSDYSASESCEAYSPDVCSYDIDRYLFSDSGYLEMPDAGFCSGIPYNPQPIIDPEYGTCNIFIKNCKCVWDDSQGECGAGYDTEARCSDDANGPDSNSGTVVGGTGTCRQTAVLVSDNCDTLETMVYRYDAVLTGVDASSPFYSQLASQCIAKPNATVKCPSTAKLPFFGLFGFAVSASVIAGIYARLLRRRRK